MVVRAKEKSLGARLAFCPPQKKGREAFFAILPPAMPEALDSTHQKYRPDIDGLRGLAVLAVVGFHAFPERFRAGFIGVDVFFVISGFLITTIILRSLAQETFGFLSFYARRVRRIFPALIVMLLASVVAGWFFFAAQEYKNLGLHTLGGATFSSNFLLWQESGYFDVAAERKPLMHLWSLAIEEQFYLLFPLVLWLAHRRRLKPLHVTCAIAAASFALNIFLITRDPNGVFYSLATRAWELMCGAALASIALHPPSWLAAARAGTERWLERHGRTISGWPTSHVLGQIASFVGLYLLILAAGLITKSDPFPGWYALLPVLGSALLICGGASSWVNRRLLANRVLVWFGLISFPLYLWHWPLLSFSRIIAGEPLAWALKLLLVAVAIVLSWLTYRFLERPLRFGSGRKISVLGILIPLGSLGVIGLSIFRADGFVFRPVARTYEMYLQSVKFGAGGCAYLDAPATFCWIGAPEQPPLAFIYGDSHAEVMRPAFAKYAIETGRSFVFASVSPPLLGLSCRSSETPSVNACGERNREIFNYVKENSIRNVILIARWTNYREPGVQRDTPARTQFRVENPNAHVIQDALEQTIEAYRQIGVRVYVIADNPLQKFLPEDIIRQSERLNDESMATIIGA